MLSSESGRTNPRAIMFTNPANPIAISDPPKINLLTEGHHQTKAYPGCPYGGDLFIQNVQPPEIAAHSKSQQNFQQTKYFPNADLILQQKLYCN